MSKYVKEEIPKVILPTHTEVYEFIESYILRNRYSPTLVEIAEGLDKTKQTVHKVVNHLVNLGCLQRIPRCKRGLQIIFHPGSLKNLNS